MPRPLGFGRSQTGYLATVSLSQLRGAHKRCSAKPISEILDELPLYHFTVSKFLVGALGIEPRTS